jgi:hypothetical protein
LQSRMVNGLKLKEFKINSMVYFRALSRFWWKIHTCWWKNKSSSIPKKRIQLQSRMVNGTKLRELTINSMVYFRALSRFWWKIYSSWWKNKSSSIPKKRI